MSDPPSASTMMVLKMMEDIKYYHQMLINLNDKTPKEKKDEMEAFHSWRWTESVEQVIRDAPCPTCGSRMNWFYKNPELLTK